MKIESIIIPMAALAAGVALGYGIAPVEVVQMADKQVKTEVKNVKLGTDGSEEALREQIRELRRQLAAKESEGRKPDETRMEEARIDDEGRRGRMNPREWMEKMKTENPEQYARMTNGMARMRARRLERAQSRLDFFDSIDTSAMSAEDREKTISLQNLLVKREELMAQMNPESDMTDEERQQLFRDMRETEHAVRELNKDVR